MVSSYERGHKIIWLQGKQAWIYGDIAREINGKRQCKRCGKPPTKKGHDACLGNLDGVKNACCGHGVERGYIQLREELCK